MSHAGRAVVVVSPHFDDAVLSCWSVLSRHGGAACVLTVFGGTPPPGRLWPWDAGGPGAVDSASRMSERREENRRALAVTGAEAIDLDLLEIQYAEEGGGRVLEADLRPHLLGSHPTYVIAGVGRERVHPDHESVRDVVLRIRPDAALYADQPYCRFPADFGQVSDLAGYRKEVVTMSAADAVRKSRAVACYKGEVVRLGIEQRLTRAASEFRHEVVWHPSR